MAASATDKQGKNNVTRQNDLFSPPMFDVITFPRILSIHRKGAKVGQADDDRKCFSGAQGMTSHNYPLNVFGGSCESGLEQVNLSTTPKTVYLGVTWDERKDSPDELSSYGLE